MNTQLIDFFQGFLGTYEPVKYEVTKKIVTNDVLNGGYDIQTWSYDVIPDGIAGVNFEYLSQFVFLIMFMILLYKIPKWSFQLFHNNSKRTMKMK